MDAIIPQVLHNLLLDKFIKPEPSAKPISSSAESGRKENVSQTFELRDSGSSFGRLFTMLGRSIKSEISPPKASNITVQNFSVIESSQRVQNHVAAYHRPVGVQYAPAKSSASEAKPNILPPPGNFPSSISSDKKDFNWVPKWFPINVSPKLATTGAAIPTPSSSVEQNGLAYQLVPLPCAEKLTAQNAIVNYNGTITNVQNGSIIGCGACKWALIFKPPNQGEGPNAPGTGTGTGTGTETGTGTGTETGTGTGTETGSETGTNTVTAETEATSEAPTPATLATTQGYVQQTSAESVNNEKQLCCSLRLCCPQNPKK